MFTDADTTQLVQDAGQMARELREMGDNARNQDDRVRAVRWLRTIRKLADYAVECRDAALITKRRTR